MLPVKRKTTFKMFNQFVSNSLYSLLALAPWIKVLLRAFKQGFGILNKVMQFSSAGSDHKACAIVQPVCIKFVQKKGQMFMFWMRDMIYVMLGHGAMYLLPKERKIRQSKQTGWTLYRILINPTSGVILIISTSSKRILIFSGTLTEGKT